MTSVLAALGLALLTFQVPAAPRAHYASPTGTNTGDGSFARPWDLATALAGGGGEGIRVQPGDTVWLRDGVYRGVFRSTLRGTEGAPVVVRAYPGERPRIDGAGSTASTLNVRGDYSVFWGLELTNSDSVRTATTASHDARPDVIVNNASHTKYVNLIVHDGGTALYTEPRFVDVEIAGCIIYNNGWQGPDRGHGHGLYLKSLTGPLVARDNVVFNQYGYGVHAYSNANSGKLVNIRIEGNVAFDNGTLSNDVTAPNILLGGQAYATGDVVRENLTFFPLRLSGANVRIGYKAVPNGDVQVERNYLAGGSPVLDFGFWKAASVTGNTLIGTATLIRRNQPGGDSAQTWRDNVEEREPRADTIVVRPNPYEKGRAHIVVYNWARLEAVDVDLTHVLVAGDRYEIRNVQNLFGPPVTQGTFTGAAVRIRMEGITPPAPTGVRAPRAPRTGPEFDVFLVAIPPLSPTPKN
jgi:hypothetical protein